LTFALIRGLNSYMSTTTSFIKDMMRPC
jgi:hypothetical protein